MTLLTAQAITDSLPQTDSVMTAIEKIDMIKNMPAEELITSLIDKSIHFGLKILAALAIYLIGRWIVRKIKNITKKIFIKRNVEPSLAGFLNSFISITLNIILVIAVIGTLGIDTTSFAAVLAAGGVAVGMALSGTLQNFAGGVMILLFRPFKVGDFIDAQGFSGTVKNILITNTYVTTPDNKVIIIPNGSLINGIINNYSATGVRRCDWSISISYGNDVKIAKEALIELMNSDPRVLKDPEKPVVFLTSMDDSDIKLSARAWVATGDYWGLFFDMNERIYETLPKKGISFPFPQMDVHIKQA